MQVTSRFWPLDYAPEEEIYENLAWDLPGYRLRRGARLQHAGKPGKKVSPDRPRP